MPIEINIQLQIKGKILHAEDDLRYLFSRTMDMFAAGKLYEQILRSDYYLDCLFS
jgi:hypothetical protein